MQINVAPIQEAGSGDLQNRFNWLKKFEYNEYHKKTPLKRMIPMQTQVEAGHK